MKRPTSEAYAALALEGATLAVRQSRIRGVRSKAAVRHGKRCDAA